MPLNEPSSDLPLADVLRAANDLVAVGLIEDWALGGALAAIYYVEPFTTYDADIFFIPTDPGLTAGIPAIYAHLQAQGWNIPIGRTAIIPLIVGDESAALALSATLRTAGHFAPAIRPPTVPAGACRLRLTVTLAHTPSDRQRLVRALAAARPKSD